MIQCDHTVVSPILLQNPPHHGPRTTPGNANFWTQSWEGSRTLSPRTGLVGRVGRHLASPDQVAHGTTELGTGRREWPVTSLHLGLQEPSTHEFEIGLDGTDVMAELERPLGSKSKLPPSPTPPTALRERLGQAQSTWLRSGTTQSRPRSPGPSFPTSQV